MITEIDVSGVLSRTVCEFHNDLVTRPTGRAVRTSIEAELSGVRGVNVVVLDFSSVRLIDCSCADEIVAKLVAGSLEPGSPAGETFFLIRGLAEHHVEQIDEVLQRQQLALVAVLDGALRLLGRVTDGARAAFERLVLLGSAAAEELASELAWSADETRAVLDELASRRLVVREAGRYLPPTSAA